MLCGEVDLFEILALYVVKFVLVQREIGMLE